MNREGKPCRYCGDRGTMPHSGDACRHCSAGFRVRQTQILLNTAGVLVLLAVVLFACGREVGWW